MSESRKAGIYLFKRLVSYAKPYRGIFALAVLCTVTLSVMAPLRPFLIGNMVSEYIVKDQNASMLFNWSLIILGMLLVEGLLQFTGSYFSNLLAQSIIRDLRKKLVGHILSFKVRYFDKTAIGALVTRVVSDLEAITEVFSSGLMDIAGDLISLIGVICFIFYLNF